MINTSLIIVYLLILIIDRYTIKKLILINNEDDIRNRKRVSSGMAT